MNNKKIIFFLNDIKNSLDKIFKYTKDISFGDFTNDDKTKDAVERNFEIIGEAVKTYQKILEINIRTSRLNKSQE